MSLLRTRLAGSALASAFVALGTIAAHAHAVCGNRIFPTTLAIDDPGVTDELTLPEVTWLPKNSDGTGELDIGGEWAKTIFPNFAISVGSGATWLHDGGFGRYSCVLDTSALVRRTLVAIDSYALVNHLPSNRVPFQVTPLLIAEGNEKIVLSRSL